MCGLEFSTAHQARACPILKPSPWPALFQTPRLHHRAVQTDSHSFPNLPNSSCFNSGSCPLTSLFTGQNKAIAHRLVRRLAIDSIPQNAIDLLNIVSLSYLGTESNTASTNFVEEAFLSASPFHVILPLCLVNFTSKVPITLGNTTLHHDIDCVESSYIWRENSSDINKELFQGFRSGNPANEIHEILGAYDFLNSNGSSFNVSVWYNSTYMYASANSPRLPQMPRLLRIPRSLNMISNAFLRDFKGGEKRILLAFVKEMPKPGTKIALDLSSTLGPLLFVWVIQLLFPVFLMSLVYEKQHKLRIMIKMHGLGDGPYWLISYGYFFVISAIYTTWFAVFGSVIGLVIFKLNNYAIQFVFYFVYLNLQIVLAFLAATAFSEVKTATVVGYMYVFGSGLLGAFFFQFYIEDPTFSRHWLMAMEVLPAFSLYQGLYELSQYALAGHYRGTSGMSWGDLNNQDNGMKHTLIVMASEWMTLLFVSYYLNQVVSLGNGVSRHRIFFFARVWKKYKRPFTAVSLRLGSTVFVDMENPDIFEERYKVDQLLKEPDNGSHPIIFHNLKKVYMGKDGNSRKHAVQSLSLAIPRGECFGMLGPNGSGKTTIINMVTGFLSPTSGTAFINDKDIRSDMDQIYTKIGVCPQQDLIWETLTGREHLLFYGRLRNLKGAELQREVDESLESLNLYGHKLARKYSGGMKRRLSIAISLIGDATVVYLDEPTTGLDPESRFCVWRAVKHAKEKRAIILTTHSMEEAEFLCDRIGIIVNGSLQCLGSSKELKMRYGGSYLLTISANPIHGNNIDQMVRSLSPNAVKVYNVAGTQKYRLPKKEVRVSDVFEAVEKFKRDINSVHAFGFADASLEDVFINVVRSVLDRSQC